MQPQKRSIFHEPAVIVALIGLIGTIVTAIVAPLIIRAVEKSTATPVFPDSAAFTGTLVPLPTYTPISLITPTATPTEEEQALQVLVDAKNWPLVFADPFDTNAYDWPEGERTSESVTADLKIINGAYLWKIRANTNSAINWVRPKIDPSQDFYVSVRARRVNDQVDMNYALTFRDQGNGNFYEFKLYMDQHFVVRIYDKNKPADQGKSEIFTNQPTTRFRPEDANKLEVVGIGNDYWFFINDQFVKHLNRTELSGGIIGLSLEIRLAGQEAQVEFDDFELRKAP